MGTIPEQNNILEQIGSFIGGKIVDAAAVASAITILRSGVRDPKIIAGAFALYATAKKEGQLLGGLSGESLDLYLKNTYDIDVDEFINSNINKINQVIDIYFEDRPNPSININSLMQQEHNIYNFYTDGLIDSIVYKDITRSFSDYYVSSITAYTPLVNNYFTPINIGAFYGSSTSQEVSLIKSKNTIRFYQANSKEVA